ncbi:MAG: ribokinase [Chloroflexi bacterium]|nr:ribokinase [Chloroflexota bacterium]
MAKRTSIRPSTILNRAAAPPGFLVIGHVVQDVVSRPDPNGEQPDQVCYRIGGSLSYSALTARNLGERVGAVTSVGPGIDPAGVMPGIPLVTVPSSATTTFENIYNDGRRKQFVRAVASPLQPQSVPKEWLAADIVHLAPVAQEVSPALAQLFARSFVGVTPQGWMRRWDADGKVVRTSWLEAGEVLKMADAVVLSVEDIVGGQNTIRSYARRTALLVVTRGSRGADLHWRGEVHHFPAFPAKEVDPTGAGDVFAAAFFIKVHRGGDPLLAMRFATCAASLAVEDFGLRGVPTLRQVEQRMEAVEGEGHQLTR